MSVPKRWEKSVFNTITPAKYKAAEKLKKNARICGMTVEAHGEAVAEVLCPYDERMVRGIIIRLLKEFPELKKWLVVALVKDTLDDKPLGEQKLYNTYQDR